MCILINHNFNQLLQMVQVSETIEQRVLAAAARPMEAVRFSIMTDSETDAPSQNNENNSSSMSAGEKVGTWIIICMYRG